MSEATTKLALQINFHAPLNCFRRDGLAALERGILALTTLRGINEAPAELATNHASDVPNVQIDPRPLAESKPDTERWLIANIFRDFVEELLAFFEGLRSVDATLDLVGSEFLYEQFQQTVEEPARAFDRLRFEQKVANLDARGLLPVDADGLLIPLNAARNCLVHRRGIVTPKDAQNAIEPILPKGMKPPAPTKLVVAWSRPGLVARHPDGREEAARPGSVFGPGVQLSVRVTATGRIFNVGEQISFTSEDLVGIWWSLSSFAEAATKLVLEKAKTRGFTFEEEQATPSETPPVV